MGVAGPAEPALAVVDVDERAAGRLAREHGLRGLDAIHLAAADELARVLSGRPPGAVPSPDAQSLDLSSATRPAGGPPDSLVFSTCDDRLRAAALAAGLWVAPRLSSP